MAYTKNYYHILGLDTPNPGSSSPRPKGADLRRAYRNALLAAHPDKKGAGAATTNGSYSVDDVKEAYTVLDDTRARTDYDNWVLRNPHIISASTGTGVDKNGAHTLSQDFILGLELLDLSDFDEQDGEAVEGEWTRACRCGDEKGFRILEDDLEDAESRGEKEVLVGCGGCSLWVRVGFDVEEG
ncbi:CSL zinc finger [Stagonosporopsis vannaccii]|nr:CSL zinc finger [Stagonosporopsis vannaccii]